MSKGFWSHPILLSVLTFAAGLLSTVFLIMSLRLFPIFLFLSLVMIGLWKARSRKELLGRTQLLSAVFFSLGLSLGILFLLVILTSVPDQEWSVSLLFDALSSLVDPSDGLPYLVSILAAVVLIPVLAQVVGRALLGRRRRSES